ncbi:hypothetical protein TIFTF001_043894 [Ficus carica]|uniref:Uncharacterized protein n=1 Tax=Ficus carica TaxID=3494 RepID=A0AA88D319_FICCA|nr:hypothetical protein TIFTF001_043894 [Ficus carica]
MFMILYLQVFKECNHLRHEGLRNKDLYYNVFEKNHAAGAFGFGSVTMGGGSTPSIDFDFSIDNSGTHPDLEEEIAPTNGARQGTKRPRPDEAGPSRSRGSVGKTKQRDATDEMTFSAMQEIVNHFRASEHEKDDQASENKQRNNDAMLAMAVVAVSASRRNRRRVP